MSNHPLILAFTFFLELAGLGAMGVWGWRTGVGGMRFVLAIGVPIVAAALWGIFRVPNDPGNALVAIPGAVRLVLELGFYGFAVLGLYDARLIPAAWVMGIVVLLRYAISYDHVLWLLRQ
ncbi:MAG: DUF2568 domain-containing protein [Clostridia bacterium]|nr:DUF2568 domain-containing protein [Clostridia bacterium]